MKRQDSNTTAALTLALLLAGTLTAATRATAGGLMQGTASPVDTRRRAEDLFAEARLHAELGGHAAAADAYRRIFEDEAQPPEVRGRARLGEGVMLRQLGRDQEWVTRFFETLEIARQTEDLDLAHELIAAAGGIALSVATWDAVLPLLAFDRVEDDEGKPKLLLPPELQRRPELAESVRGEGASPSAGPGFSGEPISISFKDAEMQDLFRMFAQVSGLNIIWAKELEGRLITLDVSDVPWDQVLALVMKTNGLGSTFEGGVLRIAPLAQLVREQDQSLALETARAQIGPTRTIARSLSFADGELAKERVSAELSIHGSVAWDRRQNALIVKDLVSRMDEIEQLLNELDVDTQGGGPFTGQPISVSFRDADLNDLFSLFGVMSGQTFVLDDRVGGTASLVASDEPWDSVLNRVLSEQGLVSIFHEGRRFVFPAPAEDSPVETCVFGDEVLEFMRPDAGW